MIPAQPSCEEAPPAVTITLTPSARARLLRYARVRGIRIEDAGANVIEQFLREYAELEGRRRYTEQPDHGIWRAAKHRAMCTRCGHWIEQGSPSVYIPATHRSFCSAPECGPAIIAAQRRTTETPA